MKLQDLNFEWKRVGNNIKSMGEILGPSHTDKEIIEWHFLYTQLLNELTACYSNTRKQLLLIQEKKSKIDLYSD